MKSIPVSLAALVTLLLASSGCSDSADASNEATVTPAQTANDGGTSPLTLEVIPRGQEPDPDQDFTTVVYGEQVTVRGHGLKPGATVTLHAAAASLRRPQGATLASATFLVDETGSIDTSKQSPTSGSYAGVDPDGLFWSMVEGATPKWMDAEDYAATVALEVDGSIALTRKLRRLAYAKDVTCETVSDGEIVGSYCAKRGAAKRTPVLAFGGSEGGTFTASWTAMIYASWGIPTLGVGYFGEGKLPKDLERIPLEYFDRAMTWLDAKPEVRSGETIVSGGSRGGELALLLGATFPRVVGVIADVPSSFTWASVEGGSAAWTRNGEDVPFVPHSDASAPEQIAGPEGTKAYRMTPMFARSVADATAAELTRATIEVERTNGPVLMLAGESDDLWPSCDFSKRAFERLGTAGHRDKFSDEMVCFPEAGHSINFVGGPTTSSMWSVMGNNILSLGGSAKGIAQAQRAADDQRHRFLDRVSRQ